MFIDPDNPLNAEILQEAGGTYFLMCRKMVESIEAIRNFDCAPMRTTGEEERIRHRMQLVDAAAERVYFVLIQREAMRFPWSDSFFEDYDVPAEVRAKLNDF